MAGGFFDGLIDNVRIYNRALSDTEVQTDMSVPVTTPTGPSAPGGLSVTARTQTSVSLQWNPSTGGSGIAGYHVFLNGAQVGTATTTTSFSFTGLSCSTSYQLGVEAFDTNGNTSGRTVQDASTSLCDAPSGLVAAYAFDETSGSVLHDSSGNGHDGTISGATWTSGHDGGALSFNGSNASVDLGSLGTFYQSGFTLEGWVQKQTSTKKDVGVLGSWSSSGGPMLWVDHLAGDYQLTLNSGLSSYLDSGHTPIGGQWQYLAATFDGSTARFYIDGVQVASRSVTSSVGSSNNWRIGAYGSVAGGFFDGLIDNVRIYNRALSDTEVQTDMSLPAPAAGVDTAAPSAPGTPTVSVDQSRVTLSWAAASDNVGVTRYDVYRSTSSGFTPSVGNRIAQPTGLSYTDAGLAIGTYYYKVQAEDAAGNIGPASSEISATVLPDTTPPTAPTNLAPSVNGGTVNLTWSPSTDDVAVTRYDVYRGTSAGFTPTAANRIAQPAGTSYGDSGLTAGSYYYKVAAEDAAGNISGPSNEAQATIADTSPPSTPSSLSATVVGTTVNLSWAASTDNIGVLRYNLYRGTSAGFTPSAANRIAQPVTTLYQDIGLAAGTYYYKLTAEDAAGNVSPLSNEVSAVSPDMTPPSAPATLTAVGGAGQASLSWSPASDNVGVTRYDLYRSTTSGFTPSVSNRIAQPTGLGYVDLGLAAGNYYYRVQAEDAAGNLSASSSEASALVTSAAPPGLLAAYGFDENGLYGSYALDSSGNFRTATLNGASWTTSGRNGGAVSLNGTNNEVDPPALGTFYKKAFTLEAWVYKQTSKVDVGVVGSWLASQNGGPMIWVDNVSGHYRLTLGATSGNYLDSGVTPAIGRWQHVAAEYDGSTARIYIDGTLAASSTFTGNVGDSNTWRIGAYGSPAGSFFDGRIDDVRIYNRALSASQVQADMANPVPLDPSPPTVISLAPADGATGVNVGSAVTARFSKPMQPSSVNTSTFKVTDPAGNTVPATVTFDAATNTGTLKPQVALLYGQTYRALLPAGGVTDLSGKALASDASWWFTTEVSPPPLLVVTSSANPFARYTSEILRAEGLDAFTTLDASLLAPAVLGNFDVVLLGDIALSAGQVTTLSNWVNGGGKLIALHPDKQLASLLGLSAVGTTLSNAYLQVNTSSGPGVGITGQTLQYHGSADRYTLNGASSLATLYSNASTATSNPALSLRSVGGSGGQAAAFTYDLARSIVYTRQGNPAWAGQERDGVNGIRPDDLFFGAKSGDVKPDWLNTSKIAIPQADEQQRLLVNLITQMERSKLPLPHFWYLPRGLKAAVAMSGDDHGAGGTSFHFDQFKQDSTPGCVVALWQCVRSTSYIYPSTPLSNAQAAGYLADGFEIGLHPLVLSCPPAAISESELGAYFDSQLLQWQAKYTSLPSPVSDRIHCVFWPGWITSAKVELAHGMRMDANYYHYPDTWIGAKPGFLNGGGFPMRFADTDGSMLDVYQSNTNMDDEANQSYPATVNALLDNALGPNGYYGVFGTNMHTDYATDNPMEDAIVSSAQARGVPVISYKQLLDWTDGRNASTIRGLSWNAGSFNFTTTVGSGAVGLQTMLPTQGPTGTLSALTCGGAPVSYNVTTIKGIQYAMFDTITGSCQAIYS